MANYLSFALSAACLGVFFARRADVMYVYHPPATIGIAALCLRVFRRIPFVYDVQDLWPDSLGATGMIRNPVLLRLVNAWCTGIYRAAAKIAVLSPGFKSKLIARGVPADNIEVIFNWSDEQHLSSNGTPHHAHLESGRFNIVFAGNMGPAQALDAVLQCAEMLRVRRPELRFVFVGSGIDLDRLKRITAERELRNVQFIPRQPPDQIGAILAAADALLVHLRSEPLFDITIPSKTQAYLAVGKPIIMAARGDAAALVEEAGAGITCAPENPASLVSAVESLLQLTAIERQKMGQNGRCFYGERLSLEVGVRKFETLLASCV